MDEASLWKVCDPLDARIGKLIVELDWLRKKVQTTRSVRNRRGLLEEDHPQISQRRQAVRSLSAFQPVPEREYGILINRKRVRWLWQAMGLEAIWCRPRSTIPARSHRSCVYPLRNLKVDRANQV